MVLQQGRLKQFVKTSASIRAALLVESLLLILCSDFRSSVGPEKPERQLTGSRYRLSFGRTDWKRRWLQYWRASFPLLEGQEARLLW